MAAAAAFTIQNLPSLIAAVGALGVAAFGAVEAIGKTLFVFDTPWFGGRKRSWGLPYVGFGIVRRMVQPFAPAMKMAYGADYDTILRQQYRDSRSTGQAPDTIRQGVRLGLPFLPVEEAAAVIQATWGMDKQLATNLATALNNEKATTAGEATPTSAATKDAQALAGRFSTALDTKCLPLSAWPSRSIRPGLRYGPARSRSCSLWVTTCRPHRARSVSRPISSAVGSRPSSLAL